MIITIDGPAGTGKTTIARKVAEKLGYEYFDTGAMYRAVTFGVMRAKIELSDREKLISFLNECQIEMKFEQEEKRYFLNGTEITAEIRSSEVTKHVSEVSAKQEVREKLVALQRKYGEGKHAVFEGRDMGSIVFPEAEVKIYLTARPAVRAERRYHEINKKHSELDLETVMNEILERDHYDSTREISPLAQPVNSHLIDTSDLTIDEVVAQVMLLVPGKKRK